MYVEQCMTFRAVIGVTPRMSNISFIVHSHGLHNSKQLSRARMRTSKQQQKTNKKLHNDILVFVSCPIQLSQVHYIEDVVY